MDIPCTPAPSYWNQIFFNGVMPLLCVCLGGLLSWLIQKSAQKIEWNAQQIALKKEQEDAAYADCTRVMIAMSTQYGAMLNLEAHIKPYTDNENRHFELKPFPPSFPYTTIAPSDLVHVLDSNGGSDLVATLLLAQSWVDATIDTVRTRNTVHLEAQRTALPAGDRDAIVHPGLVFQMKDLTTGLYSQVSETIVRINRAAGNFSDFIAKNYPGRPVRKLEKIEPK